MEKEKLFFNIVTLRDIAKGAFAFKNGHGSQKILFYFDFKDEADTLPSEECQLIFCNVFDDDAGSYCIAASCGVKPCIEDAYVIENEDDMLSFIIKWCNQYFIQGTTHSGQSEVMVEQEFNQAPEQVSWLLQNISRKLSLYNIMFEKVGDTTLRVYGNFDGYSVVRTADYGIEVDGRLKTTDEFEKWLYQIKM